MLDLYKSETAQKEHAFGHPRDASTGATPPITPFGTKSNLGGLRLLSAGPRLS